MCLVVWYRQRELQKLASIYSFSSDNMTQISFDMLVHEIFVVLFIVCIFVFIVLLLSVSILFIIVAFILFSVDF